MPLSPQAISATPLEGEGLDRAAEPLAIHDQNQWLSLSDRGLMELSGKDCRSFLQGMVTADITKLTAKTPLYAALLTPQGKFLDDFFLLQPAADQPDTLWLDAPKERLAPIARRLALYKLRADVAAKAIQPALHVYVSLDPQCARQTEGLRPKAGLCWADPRPARDASGQPGAPDRTKTGSQPTPAMGWRLYSPLVLEAAAQPGSALDQAYQQRRIALGLPDGGLDLERERSTLLDNGFERTGAIAWDKGCYMGQEITARMRYRGLAKWALRSLRLEAGNFADFDLGQGAEVTLDGKTIGQIRSCSGNLALARLRCEALTQGLDRFMVHHHPVTLLD